MNDACICIEDEGEIAEFYHNKIHTAKKEHKCIECEDTIKRGEKYEKAVGKWDKDFITFKTCKICLQIRKDFFTCGWHHGYMWEYLREHFREIIRYEDGNENLTKEKIEKELEWIK